MADHRFFPDRRAVGLGLAAVGAASGLGAGRARAHTPVIAVLGDSITAGYGLPVRSQALPNQLQLALAHAGLSVRVIGAGVSGDTTADALKRVEHAIPRGVDLCLVALGGNDLIEGVSPARTRSNLDAIVRRLKARRIPVAIAGMRAPPLMEPDYVRAFDAVFPTVARDQHVPLYPYLLDGVAMDARYNQSDRIHPNAAGVRLIAARLAPFVAGALRRG